MSVLWHVSCSIYPNLIKHLVIYHLLFKGLDKKEGLHERYLDLVIDSDIAAAS